MTRFYVVSDGEPSLEASDCTTFTATGSASALPDMLKELDAQGMTLVSIHDRPAKTTLGQYVYVVECSGGGQAAPAAAEAAPKKQERPAGEAPAGEKKRNNNRRRPRRRSGGGGNPNGGAEA